MSTFYLDYENGSDAGTGADWANAWKTITAGATAARIAPGDTIRIAKSPAPVSLGDALWTNNSSDVVLDTAQNVTIDNCEVAWTTGGGIVNPSVSLESSKVKQGSKSTKVYTQAIQLSDTLYAYKATGTLDLSAYQKITFWFQSNVAVLEDQWTICLCSDAAGTTVVDKFVIPATALINSWYPLTLTKLGGGNLGSAIESIAIYSGSTNPPVNYKQFYFDNFSACTTNGLNLLSLISKTDVEQGGDHGWYALNAIDEETLNVTGYVSSSIANQYPYSGATETVETYARETIHTDYVAVSSALATAQDSGTSGNPITYSGGWNTSTTTQDGETFFDGQNGNGLGFTTDGKDYLTLDRLHFYRYNIGLDIDDTTNNIEVNYIQTGANNSDGIKILHSAGCHITNYAFGIGNVEGLSINSSQNVVIDAIGQLDCCHSHGIMFQNQYSGVSIGSIDSIANCGFSSQGALCFYSAKGVYIGTISYISLYGSYGDVGVYYTESRDNVIDEITLIDNADLYAIYFGENCLNNTINEVETTDSGTSAIYLYKSGPNYINNLLINEATKVTFNASDYFNAAIFSTNYAQTVDNHKIFYEWGEVTTLATDRPSGTGIMWRTEITDTDRDIGYPIKLSVAKIACAASSLVTVKAWVKKSHATDVAAQLYVDPHGVAGVSRTYDVKADDTNWEELELTFTPTAAGVVEIELHTWSGGGTGSSYIDDLTITQA